jgi:5-methylcytosine-specific restriction protein A
MPRAIGREINNRLNLGGINAYYRSTGNFFHKLINFPGVLIDPHGYIFFNNQFDYENDPELEINERTHFKPYINCLNNHSRYIRFNDIQQSIVNQVIIGESNFQDEDRNLPPVSRRRVNIDSIQRNRRHVDKIKQTRNNTCQICAIRLGTENRPYSEVHHIRPLGEPHNGDDILGNMICVCPNCHKELDYLFIPIDKDFIIGQNNENHTIENRFIQWHNDRFYKH